MSLPDLNGPSLAPPPGVVPQMDNPPNGNSIALSIITVCVVLTAFFYMVRFYAKYLTKKIGIADHMSFVAFPLFWVYVYYSNRLSWSPGYMVHMWNIRLGELSNFTYTSIFVPESQSKRSPFAWACYSSCAAIGLLSAIIFIMYLVNCTPFQGNWDPLVPDRKCKFAVPEFGLASSVTNLALDIVPLCLAQKVIWGLRMSWRRKVGISAVFLVGIMSVRFKPSILT
ncbi:hypothetical protein V8F33_010539 [Rhypophila sp. PSN 637]